MNDTDPIAQISAALDAGPTPGPWHVDHDRRPGMSWNRHIYHGADLAICFMAHSDGKDQRQDEANASFIATCNPQNIAAVLNELDRLRAAAEAHGNALQRAATAAGLLAGDDMHTMLVPTIERLRAAVTALASLVQRDRVALYEAHHYPHSGEIDEEGREALAEYDAALRLADAALGVEGTERD